LVVFSLCLYNCIPYAKLDFGFCCGSFHHFQEVIMRRIVQVLCVLSLCSILFPFSASALTVTMERVEQGVICDSCLRDELSYYGIELPDPDTGEETILSDWAELEISGFMEHYEGSIFARPLAYGYFFEAAHDLRREILFFADKSGDVVIVIRKGCLDLDEFYPRFKEDVESGSWRVMRSEDSYYVLTNLGWFTAASSICLFTDVIGVFLGLTESVSTFIPWIEDIFVAEIFASPQGLAPLPGGRGNICADNVALE